MLQEKGRREPVASQPYAYQVHASYKSDTCLIVSKKTLPAQAQTTPPLRPENPYIHKPKSYSSRRNVHNDLASIDHPRANPSKKIKRDQEQPVNSLNTLTFDKSKLISAFSTPPTEYFPSSFFQPHSKINQNPFPQFPIQSQKLTDHKMNPMMKNEITIISNENEKINVIIHDGLLNANISHSKVNKDEHFLKGVVNPFDQERKNHYLEALNFQRDYKSGYAPIDMQMRNEDAPEEQIPGNRTHFIRKKQSTLSLPRSCGVSYIKPSESHQKHPFDPLPPLIFQCSSNCSDSPQNKVKFAEALRNFVDYNKKCWIPYIKVDESEMRELLLGSKIGEVGWVRGIQNLWPLYSEGVFLLLLYTSQKCESEEQIWQAYSSCDFKVGILTKRSTSGKKSFLRSFGIDEFKNSEQKHTNLTEKNSNEENSTPEKQETNQQKHVEEKKQSGIEEELAYQLKDSRTVITLSLRLELYVEEKQWKKAKKQEKDFLYCLITELKEQLEKISIPIIQSRFNCAKSENKKLLLEETIRSLRKYGKRGSKMSEEANLAGSSKPIKNETIGQMLVDLIKNDKQKSQILEAATNAFTFEEIIEANKNESLFEKSLKMPLYYISTRDSFAFDLVEEISYFKRNGHDFKKIKYYFEPENLPANYGSDYKSRFPNFDVGITCYHDFFSDEELKQFERNTFNTEKDAFKNKFLQMTVQPSITGTKIKRTKFFFGYRYMWTRCQLAEPGSYIGAGVRKDVTPPPEWTGKIVDAFVESNIAEKDFINSIAINVYHDGKQGLAQHFDDAVRFRQPIYTLRLFSDARLSFGSQFYGFCNGAFIIPLPRGCICVMEQNSYAANGVKHCVRPCDMTGKSSAVILRQMHHQVVSEAGRFDELIDFPSWVSSLSEHEKSTTFAEQKRREAEFCLSNAEMGK